MWLWYKRHSLLFYCISKFKILPWDLLHVPLPETSVYCLKKYTIELMLFSISMRKTESPHEKFFVTFGTCEKIEVKRGHLVKKWEFGQTKKIYYINFSKLEYVPLWTMVNFHLKVPQIWDLSSKIQGFEASARWP